MRTLSLRNGGDDLPRDPRPTTRHTHVRRRTGGRSARHYTVGTGAAQASAPGRFQHGAQTGENPRGVGEYFSRLGNFFDRENFFFFFRRARRRRGMNKFSIFFSEKYAFPHAHRHPARRLCNFSKSLDAVEVPFYRIQVLRNEYKTVLWKRIVWKRIYCGNVAGSPTRIASTPGGLV
jgi:hypothetical protein